RLEPDSVADCAEIIAQSEDNDYFKPFLNARFAKWANLKAQREDLRAMIDNIREETREFFREATWLDDPTRAKSIEKLDKMKAMLGGPNDIEVGDEIVLKFQKDNELLFGNPKNSHYENMVQISTFRKRWRFLCLTIVKEEEFQKMDDLSIKAYYSVNAYYDPIINRMMIIGGICRPPFYNLPGGELFSYAKLGSVIGHEIMHGFDLQGSARNAEGQVFDWWTTETKQNYNKTQTCFINQMNKFEYRGLK
ncbi:hypothetical protein Ciccas_014362, partial [Cichlidogyrus casuarinus]